MRRGYVIAAAFLLVGAGCASFHPRPLSPAREVADFEARRLDAAPLKEYLEKNLGEIKPWPPRSWDLTMLTWAAFHYHPDMTVARTQWETAGAGVITAGQRPNPSFNFTPQYDAHSPAGLPPWTLTSLLNIPIETAGKRRYRIERAEHLFEAAGLQVATVAWRIRSRLRTSLLDLYAPDQLEATLEKQLSAQGEYLKLLEKRLEVGEASRPDVALAYISYDQARLSLEEAKKQKAQARVQLAASIGLAPAALDGAGISFAFVQRLPSEPALPAIRRTALLGRSDILTALSEYEASQSALRLEIARQYPDILLGPGYEYDQGEHKWSIGFSLTLPVFNQNQGPIAEAEARRKQAEARFIGVQARVLGEIDAALAGYRASLRKLEVADGLVAEKRKQLRATEAMLRVGETDRLALLSAQFQLASDLILRLDALVEAQRSLGLLEEALQSPLDCAEHSSGAG